MKLFVELALIRKIWLVPFGLTKKFWCLNILVLVCVIPKLFLLNVVIFQWGFTRLTRHMLCRHMLNRHMFTRLSIFLVHYLVELFHWIFTRHMLTRLSIFLVHCFLELFHWSITRHMLTRLSIFLDHCLKVKNSLNFLEVSDLLKHFSFVTL